MHAHTERFVLVVLALLASPALGLQPGDPDRAAAELRGVLTHADGLMTQLSERPGVPGLQAAVANTDGLIWSGAYGSSDLDNQIATTTHTRFGIGSITKSLTILTASRLAELGVIDLDAPIETYLPDYPHAGRGVTIRLIGAHLSGLSDDLAAANRTTTTHYDSPTVAFELLRDEPLTAEPGEALFYATGSFTTIGAALEAATGRPFEELVQEHVLGPAGMIRTVANDPAEPIAGLSVFYIADPDGGETTPAASYDPSYKLPGAGYLSTAEDLCRLGVALLNGRVVSPESRDTLWTNMTTPDGESTGFGLGFRDDELEDGTRVVHQPGGGIGISCWLFVLPDDGLTVAVLSNQTVAPVGGRETFELMDLFLAASRGEESEKTDGEPGD